MPPKLLTANQKAFVDAYLGEARGNATQAAILAGYSPKSAPTIGTRLVHHPAIRGQIERAVSKLDTSTAKALERVAKIAAKEPAKGFQGSDVLKANELILKVNGALRDNSGDSGRVTVNIGFLVQQQTEQPTTITLDASQLPAPTRTIG